MTRLSYILTIGLVSFLLSNCTSVTKSLVSNEDLKIKPISKNTYLHVSYLHAKSFGRVPCNGLVYINNGEAIIFDAPVKTKAAEQLLNWIEEEQHAKVKAIIPTHFHVDCLGSLDYFHKKGIPSFANAMTIELADKDMPIPQNGFKNNKEISIGDEKVILTYPGEGHTKDNIVGFIPSERVLFGGCLIKSLNAPKGNLADANEEHWSNTVKNVKERFPEAKIIIPGHGSYGDRSLLDYTIAMFDKEIFGG
ncbi:MAG: subclass B1 metallo-beta-lactamase [Bacteroidota bacterium]